MVCGLSAEVVKLWQGDVPFSQKPKAENVITEKRKGAWRMTEVTDPEYVVYRPTEETRTGKALIICPGGGYAHLVHLGKGKDLAEYFVQRGFTCFVLHYQVPHNREGAKSDAIQAVKMIRARAAEYQINPQQIGMLGSSAGGHLVATVSTHADQTVRPHFTILMCAAYLTEPKSEILASEFANMSQTPPFFICSAIDDQWYAMSSIVFSAELQRKKLPYEFHMISEGGHSYGLKENNRAAEIWPELMMKWIARLDL